MKKYTFRMIETITKIVEVEADDIQEAEDIAFDTTDMDKNMDDYSWECDLISEEEIDDENNEEDN